MIMATYFNELAASQTAWLSSYSQLGDGDNGLEHTIACSWICLHSSVDHSCSNNDYGYMVALLCQAMRIASKEIVSFFL
jgi:hypothetical protein